MEFIDFVNRITEWHENIIEQLSGVSSASDDTVTIELVDKNGKKQVLTTEQAKYYKAGIGMALDAFAQLPFELVESSKSDDPHDWEEEILP